MALIYKINVLEALKQKGITTYSLRKDKVLSESTIQKLRDGVGVSWENLETLCRLLDCDISDIVVFEKDN